MIRVIPEMVEQIRPGSWAIIQTDWHADDLADWIKELDRRDPSPWTEKGDPVP